MARANIVDPNSDSLYIQIKGMNNSTGILRALGELGRHERFEVSITKKATDGKDYYGIVKYKETYYYLVTFASEKGIFKLEFSPIEKN